MGRSHCIIVVGKEAAPEASALGGSRTVVECKESKVAKGDSDKSAVFRVTGP